MSAPMLGTNAQEVGIQLVRKTRTVHKTFTAAATNNVAGLIIAGDRVEAILAHNDTALTRGFTAGIAGDTARFGTQGTTTIHDETTLADYNATPTALSQIYPADTNVLVTGTGGDLVAGEKVTFTSIVWVQRGSIGRKASGM